MPTLAELGIRIDSTDAAKASSVLDKLTASAGRAEKATEGVARGADKASRATKNQTNETSGLLSKLDAAFKGLGRLEGLQSSGQKPFGPFAQSTFSAYLAKHDTPQKSGPNLDAFEQKQKDLEVSGQRAVLSVGRGDRQNKLNADLNAADDEFSKQASLLDQSDSVEYDKNYSALAAAHQKVTDQIRQNYSDLQAAQGDWTNGASAALDDYMDKAGNVAATTKDAFTKAFGSMEEAIFNFAMTGKFSFSGFAKSILDDMAKLAARQASSSLLSSLFGLGVSLFSGAVSGAGSTPAPTTMSVGGFSSVFTPQLSAPGISYQTPLPSFQAKGGAWSGGVQMFANGGAFTNNIVSTPTAFGMAGGRSGVMGEAGPEAIMPLTRTSSGALGVRSIGGGSGGSSVQISAPVTVVTQDRSGEGMQLDQQSLQQNLQAQMQAAAERAVADSWRAGGVSYRNVNGRA